MQSTTVEYDENLTIRRIISAIENGRNVILHGPGGTGKCLSPECEVLMYNLDTYQAKDIEAGMYLMGDDSMPRLVESVCHGTDEMFEISEILDASCEKVSYTVNSHHILSLKRVKSAQIEWNIQLKAFILTDVDINNVYQTTFSVKDYESVGYAGRAALDFQKQIKVQETETIDISLRDYISRTDEWKEWFLGFAVGVEHTTAANFQDVVEEAHFMHYNQFIPDYVYTATISQRKLLLDNYFLSRDCSNNPVKIIDCINQEFRDSLVFLSRSVGYKTTFFNLVVTITTTPKFPTRSYRTFKFRVNRVGKGPYCGFVIDGNRRFLLGNFIVTHNTHTIKKVAEYFTRKGDVCECTATTGVAAIGINVPEYGIQARTLHSWSGIGMPSSDRSWDFISVVEKKPKAVKRWLNTFLLIIDEISMLGKNLYDALSEVGKAIRKSKKPFGGIILLLSGDFLQLPPVKDEWCFLSKEWDKLDAVIFEFDEPKRYDDLSYFQLLLRIRKGEHTQKDVDVLCARMRAYKKFKELEKTANSVRVQPTILFPKRVDVDGYNKKELMKLEAKAVVYKCVDTFQKRIGRKYSDEYSDIPADYTKLLDDAIPQEITLKVGAQVMLKYNLDVASGLANGSRAVILDTFADGVYVKFLNGTKMLVNPAPWEVSDKEGKGIRTQIPFVCAWALTVHKSQGSTLDYAICDLSSVFCPAQSYVSLSRVKNLKGLLIQSFDPEKIICDKKALEHANAMKSVGCGNIKPIPTSTYLKYTGTSQQHISEENSEDSDISVLDALGITSKDEYKCWLLKNHPDKIDGASEDVVKLCASVIEAAKEKGW